MFIRYFIELPIPADRVEQMVRKSPTTWIPGLADEASTHGEQLLAKVGVGDRVRLAHRVIVELGEPLRFRARTVVPLRWWPATAGALLPALDADIEIGSLTPASTHLSMSARYEPPMGRLGSSLDEAFLHRVAEATVKHFLDGVGTTIMVAAAASTPGH